MFIHPSVPVPDCGRISDPAALSPQGTTTTSLLAVILENAWPLSVAPSRPFTLRLAKIAPDWRIHPILIYPALGRTRRLLATRLLDSALEGTGSHTTTSSYTTTPF